MEIAEQPFFSLNRLSQIYIFHALGTNDAQGEFTKYALKARLEGNPH
jgi:hypothetical protein